MLYATAAEWYFHKESNRNLVNLLSGYAKQLGLDETSFQECVESRRKRKIWVGNQEEGEKVFVRGVPTMLLNGTKIMIKNEAEYIESQIEIEMKKLKSQ